jgi:large subunit ribosomal protein L18
MGRAIKEIGRFYRHNRIRHKVVGTTERPRLCVHRSLNSLQAQIINDEQGKTICGLSTLNKDLRKKVESLSKTEAATVLGEALAKTAIEKGIKKVCFDRGGYQFHGRVKAFAEAARQAGLEF